MFSQRVFVSREEISFGFASASGGEEVDYAVPVFGSFEVFELGEGSVEGFEEAVEGETGFGVGVEVEALFEVIQR